MISGYRDPTGQFGLDFKTMLDCLFPRKFQISCLNNFLLNTVFGGVQKTWKWIITKSISTQSSVCYMLVYFNIKGKDKAIVGVGGNAPPPHPRFKKKFSIYNILFLAICFNKIALCPPQIDIKKKC